MYSRSPVVILLFSGFVPMKIRVGRSLGENALAPTVGTKGPSKYTVAAVLAPYTTKKEVCFRELCCGHQVRAEANDGARERPNASRQTPCTILYDCVSRSTMACSCIIKDYIDRTAFIPYLLGTCWCLIIISAVICWLWLFFLFVYFHPMIIHRQ